MQDIDSILEGVEPEETKAEEVTTETPTEDVEAQPEEAKGEQVEAEEASASEQEPQPTSETPSLEELMSKVDGLTSALTAERKKRQEAEKSAKEPQKLPDVFEDQEGFTNLINQRITEAQFNAQANISEHLARRDFPDLDDKIEKFKELQEADPTLANRVRNSASPFHEIADIVVKAEKLAKLDDVEAVEAEIRAKVEAEVREKLKAELSEAQKLKEQIPQSLSDQGSKGSIKSNTHAGPTPLSSLLDN